VLHLRSLFVATVLALVPGAFAPAHADSYVHDDRTGDVVVVEFAGDGESCDVCQGVEHPSADVVRFTARYARVLRLSLSMEELSPRAEVVWVVRYGPDQWLLVAVKQTAQGLRCHVVESSDSQHPVGCGDIEVSLDRTSETYHAALPVHWVHAAASVRVGAGASYSTGARLYIDDGLRDRFNPFRRRGLAFATGPSIARG
jgi:hypothetical protein